MMMRLLYSILCFAIVHAAFPQTGTYHEGLMVYKTQKDGNTLFGFKNTKGHIVIPARYDSVVSPFYLGRAIVISHAKTGTIDKDGKTIIPFEYKSILKEQYNLTPVKDMNGRWGFCSYKGSVQIPCAFDNFKFLSKGKYIQVQKNGKWGLINQKNTVLIPFEYKIVEQLSPKQYRLTRYNKWELANTSNNFEYDSVHFLTAEILSYNLNGWVGLIRTDGSVLLKSQYEEIGSIQNDLVTIQKFGLWGVKRMHSEEWILPNMYDVIKMDSAYIYAGLSIGTGKMHWKLFNHSGVELNPEIFLEYRTISNDMRAVKSVKGEWGFLNALGASVIPCSYIKAGDFKNGLCFAETEHESFIINKNGDVVLSGQDVYLYKIGLLKLNALQNKTYLYNPLVYTELIPVDSSFVKIKQNGKIGLISTGGEQILPAIYTDIKVGDSRTTFSVVLNNKPKIVRIINGKAVTYNTDKKINSIEGFYEEYAMMLYNGGIGFVDNEGRIRVSPQYTKARNYQNGVAAIQLNGKWGLIDKNESLVAQPYYESISPFVHGVCIVKEKGLYYLLSAKGKILTPDGFENIIHTAHGNYILYKNTRYGLANKYGKEVLSAKYEHIEELNSNLFKVQADHLWGVIDDQQKIVLHFKYAEIFYQESTGKFLTCEQGATQTVKVD